MEILLETNNLTKVYGNKKVVNNLNLKIEKSEIYGFIGKNGAGKTTTLKLILDLIKANSGDIKLFGTRYNVNSKDISRNIGSIIEYPSFYEDLTAYENLKLHCVYMNINEFEVIDEMLKKFDLYESRNKKVKDFSLGMKERLGISRALLHKPKLLILDEPTNGLDPLGIKKLRELLQRLVIEDGLTVLISSHLLSEIDFICSKFGIINDGILIKELTRNQLNEELKKYAILKVNDLIGAKKIIEEKYKFKVELIENKSELKFELDNIDILSCINESIIKNSIKLYETKFYKENLEDFFIRIISGVK